MALIFNVIADCNYEGFYEIASLLEDEGYVFYEKVDGFDSLYWDFKIDQINASLSYGVYDGVSIIIDGEVKELERVKSLVQRLQRNE